MKTIEYLLITLSLIFVLSCDDDEFESRSHSSVNTDIITEINEEGATFNAEIINIGSDGISDYGFVYGETIFPTIENSERISLGERTAEGRYSAYADRQFKADRKYFIKAFAMAKGSGTVVYGEYVEFISEGESTALLEGFFPKSGIIGDTVVLTGFGFSNLIRKNRVLFDGNNAQVIKASKDSVWFIVPESTPPGEVQLVFRSGHLQLNPEEKFNLIQ